MSIHVKPICSLLLFCILRVLRQCSQVRCIDKSFLTSRLNFCRGFAGLPRRVTCDTWRAFTNCKPDAMVNQRVQQDIAVHYSKLSPKPRRMEVTTDGCASQFKGRINFWMVGGGMFSAADYGGTSCAVLWVCVFLTEYTLNR